MNRLKNIWSLVWKYIGNRYVILSIIFAFWLIFLDTNNLITQFQMRQELSKLEKLKKFYLLEIEKNKAEIHRLTYDQEYLERYGRENYLMKKENEDIFLFVEKK
ncbi:MAG: septum formation initiator family protein [Bacteroidales bacterium]